MADKFAVYSDDKDVVDLAQVLRLNKALSVPWYQFTFAGGTTETIPDAGNVAPEAVDKVVFYETGLSSGSGTRTLKLPETPVDGQVIVIKDVNAGSSNLVIERFDASDSVDGAASYTLTYDNQAVVLRPAEESAGVWAWSILAEYNPRSLDTQTLMAWGGEYDYPSLPANTSYLQTGYVTDNAGASSLTPCVYVCPESGQVSRLTMSIILNGLSPGSEFYVSVRKNGSPGIVLGPYTDATPIGAYTSTTGNFSVARGDIVDCQLYFTSGATGDLNLAVSATLEM